MQLVSLKRFSLFVFLLLIGISVLQTLPSLSGARDLSYIYILFLGSLSILVHWQTRSAIKESRQAKATRVIISMISIKLFGSIALLALFYWWKPEAARMFIIPFLLIYFSFTLYEIFSLQRVERESAS